MSNPLKMGRTEWVMLFMLATMWGGSFFFAKIALQQIAPMTLVFLRVSLGAVALLVILKLMRKRIPGDARIWMAFFVMGLLNNLIPFALLFWGQTHIASGLAAIFNATAPIFTIVVAHFLTRDEKMTLPKAIGIAAGFAGVLILIGVDIQRGVDRWAILAMLGCLLAGLSYGFAAVYGKRFKAFRVDPIAVAFGQVFATSIMVLPVVAFFQPGLDVGGLTGEVILAVLALAIVSTAMAYVIFFRILERGGATNISLVAFLIPVSAIMLGTIFLGEQLHANHFLGMLAIFIGLIALDGSAWSWSTRFTRGVAQGEY